MQTNFWQPLISIDRVYSIPALLLGIGLTSAAFMVPSRKRYLYIAALTALGLLTWFEASLLVWGEI